MGIKRKIIVGFISIGTLLFLSGLISSFELIRFNSSTYDIMKDSRQSVENSAKMLDAIQKQNTALLLGITDSTGIYDSIFNAAAYEFQRALATVSTKFASEQARVKIVNANNAYTTILNAKPNDITLEWFSDVYKIPYYNLTFAIKEFMLITQGNIISSTEDLHKNAYRASMIGIIALAAGVLLILLFFFMVNSFFISPVLKIHNSLKRAITLKIPYKVVIDTEDELKILNENIGNLIEKNRKNNL